MNYRKVVKIMLENGYYVKSTNGSHVKFEKEGGVQIVIPNHNGKDICRKMLKRLFKLANIKVAV